MSGPAPAMRPQFTLAHVGINTTSPEAARQAAERLCTLFGFAPAEGEASIFTGGCAEVLKAPGAGRHGHIAFATENLPAAVAHLQALGAEFAGDTSPEALKNARLIYLKEEIAGFAIHLLQS